MCMCVCIGEGVGIHYMSVSDIIVILCVTKLTTN